MLERPINADVYPTLRAMDDKIDSKTTELVTLIEIATQLANDALNANATGTSWKNEQW